MKQWYTLYVFQYSHDLALVHEEIKLFLTADP